MYTFESFYLVLMNGGDLGGVLLEKLDLEGVGFGCIARRIEALSPVSRTARIDFSARAQTCTCIGKSSHNLNKRSLPTLL